jgi:hypothetical protein
MQTFATRSPDNRHPADSRDRRVGTLARRRERAAGVSSSGPSLLQRKSHCACGGGCPTCEAESGQHGQVQVGELDEVVQRKPSPGQPDCVPPVVQTVLQSAGEPLDDALRRYFEPRFDHDFSGVRLHAGAEASASASSVGALAYTVGKNIVFARARVPTSLGDRDLLAHELTHVVQQARGTVVGEGVIAADHESEREADRVAERIASGGALPPLKPGPVFGGAASRTLQRLVVCDEEGCRDEEAGVSVMPEDAEGVGVSRPQEPASRPQPAPRSSRRSSTPPVPISTESLSLDYVQANATATFVPTGALLQSVGYQPSAGLLAQQSLASGAAPAEGLLAEGALAEGALAEGVLAEGALATTAAAEATGTAGALAEAAAALTAVEVGGGAEIEAATGPVGWIVGGVIVLTIGGLLVGAWLLSEDEPQPQTPPQPLPQTRTEPVPQTRTEPVPQTRTEPVPQTRTEPSEEERRRETCATRYPTLRQCNSLPPGYTYSSPQAALNVLKVRLGKKDLRLHQHAVTTSGPCPGIGMHYNVRLGSQKVASIGCCPCCTDTPAGPISMTRCAIL